MYTQRWKSTMSGSGCPSLVPQKQTWDNVSGHTVTWELQGMPAGDGAVRGGGCWDTYPVGRDAHVHGETMGSKERMPWNKPIQRVRVREPVYLSTYSVPGWAQLSGLVNFLAFQAWPSGFWAEPAVCCGSETQVQRQADYWRWDRLTSLRDAAAALRAFTPVSPNSQLPHPQLIECGQGCHQGKRLVQPLFLLWTVLSGLVSIPRGLEATSGNKASTSLCSFQVTESANHYWSNYYSVFLGVALICRCLVAVSNSYATPWTPPGSSVHAISQASILEWVAIPFSRGSSWPRDQTRSPAFHVGSFTLSYQGSPLCWWAGHI